MPAIKYQKFSTSDKAWDVGKNEKNLKAGQDRSYYEKCYAWRDPDADDTTKSAYKFLHNEVDSDGSLGDANIKACQSIIGILNGAMGGTDIPDADRQGVYDHAAKHLKDAGVEPADLKSRSKNPFGVPVNCRSVADIQADTKAGNVLEGHAAVFGQMYQVTDWDGTYNEVIERGSFDKTDFTDVPFTINHNLDMAPMARSRNNTPNSTLQLSVDNVGLLTHATLDIDNNEDSKKIYSAISRGDLSDMSYIFTVRDENGKKGEYWEGLDTDMPTRHITDIAKVYEVSAVTWGANPGTDINARSHDMPESVSALESARKELESSESRSTNTNNLEFERFKAELLAKY